LENIRHNYFTMRRPRQRELFAAATPKKRGRPKKQGAGMAHTRRSPVNPGHPHLVTIRVRTGTWNLRSQRCFAVIVAAFNTANARKSIRIVHYTVQGNHVHLLVEADDRRAMSNGMRALLISLARRLNVLMDTTGPRFADRFHERALATPNAVRIALRYVLTNAAKHHGHDPVDPYSSGPWFTGWPAGTKLPRWTPCTGPPTASPESWLLRGGWKRAGAI
jgi:REP element-mobilizing transposase RayT